MKNVLSNFNYLSRIILAVVFFYTSAVKLGDFSGWENRYNQIDIVNDFHLNFGAYLIPIMEIMVALALFSDKYKLVSAWVYFFMMLLFTLYIYYKIYVWEDSLCPCGGIFSQLTLDKHLWVNIGLTLLSLCVLILNKREKLYEQNH